MIVPGLQGEGGFFHLVKGLAIFNHARRSPIQIKLLTWLQGIDLLRIFDMSDLGHFLPD